MLDALRQQIEALTGRTPERLRPLSGGCIADVYRVDFASGDPLVAKAGDGSGPSLTIEAFMLRYLREHSSLPVPEVVYDSDTLLLMTFLPGDSHFNARAQAHAAELIAALHEVRGEAFGFERDTLIGSLRQPNPPAQRWLPCFREQRLLYMTQVAVEAGQLSPEIARRLERFAADLERWLIEPPYPALIHGDLWTTNILAQDGRITGFLDPAIYYAHPEIELAFSTLFNTFDATFF